MGVKFRPIEIEDKFLKVNGCCSADRLFKINALKRLKCGIDFRLATTFQS